MTMEAHRLLEGDCFGPARDDFEKVVAWLDGPASSLTFAELEEQLDKRVTVVSRLLCQGWLDERSRAERREFARTRGPEDKEPRSYSRYLECRSGRVRVSRLCQKVPGGRSTFPLDKQLNLPGKIYSHPLQQRVLEEARDRSWDRALAQIDRTTGGHVPKRQAQEIAIDVAQDVEAFYQQREPPKPMSPTAHLLGASDCTGMRMLAKDLREATRKAAAADKAAATRGDPMAPKKLRTHDKRMAAVTKVWEQEPVCREASDIISELNRTPKAKSGKGPQGATQSADKPASSESVPKAKGSKAQQSAQQPQDTPSSVKEAAPQKVAVCEPDSAPKAKRCPKQKAARPQNVRFAASVRQSVSEGVAGVFDEFDRRDPERVRTAAMLVDGDEKQQTAILEEGSKRRRAFALILDIIHVIHYLWLAGHALCHKNRAATETWLRTYLLMLLTSPVTTVIAAIETEAATKRLSKSARKSVDKALGYLRRNAPFMDYARYLAEGFPIATGAIEGACRHLVKDRLGITGARWSLEGGEAMLRLRALYASGDWDAYWRFHLKQEALRNYAAAA
jgi:hypothetical protein